MQTMKVSARKGAKPNKKKWPVERAAGRDGEADAETITEPKNKWRSQKGRGRKAEVHGLM